MKIIWSDKFRDSFLVVRTMPLFEKYLSSTVSCLVILSSFLLSPLPPAHSQKALITSVNLSLSHFATCFETIRYTPTSPTQTTFSQTAAIQARIFKWRTAADGLENWLVQRFEQNASQGKVGFTDVLRKMWGDAQEKTSSPNR